MRQGTTRIAREPSMNTARLQPRLAATVSFSPRLQHAVRLLQMSTLDYAQALRDAALDNPFLDVEMSDGPAGADEHRLGDDIIRAGSAG